MTVEGGAGRIAVAECQVGVFVLLHVKSYELACFFVVHKIRHAGIHPLGPHVVVVDMRVLFLWYSLVSSHRKMPKGSMLI